MIRFALKCAKGHDFESWFSSNATFDELQAGGHVLCPKCNSSDVEKALMAPPVRASRKGAKPVDAPQPMASSPDPEVAAAIRLPAYLAQRDVTAVAPGQGGYRVALVFAPQAGLSGESVCKGKAKGGQAGAATKVLIAFCRSEATILSETRLEATGGFAPATKDFQAGMSRAMKEILPRRSPFDEGDRFRRRGG